MYYAESYKSAATIEYQTWPTPEKILNNVTKCCKLNKAETDFFAILSRLKLKFLATMKKKSIYIFWNDENRLTGWGEVMVPAFSMQLDRKVKTSIFRWIKSHSSIRQRSNPEFFDKDELKMQGTSPQLVNRFSTNTWRKTKRFKLKRFKLKRQCFPLSWFLFDAQVAGSSLNKAGMAPSFNSPLLIVIGEE